MSKCACEQPPSCGSHCSVLNEIHQIWWHTPVIPALWGLRKKDQWPAWAAVTSCLTRTKVSEQYKNYCDVVVIMNIHTTFRFCVYILQ